MGGAVSEVSPGTGWGLDASQRFGQHGGDAVLDGAGGAGRVGLDAEPGVERAVVPASGSIAFAVCAGRFPAGVASAAAAGGVEPGGGARADRAAGRNLQADGANAVWHGTAAAGTAAAAGEGH